MNLFEPLPGRDPTADQLQRTERIGFWFALSLTVLFVVAELSAPGPLVLVAALVYCVAAIAWTIVIYQQWSSGRLALPRLAAILSATGVGVGMLLAGLALETWTPFGRTGSILLLAGLLLAYIGAGLAITRIRAQVWAAPESGAWWARLSARTLVCVLGGLIIGTAIGALLLGWAPLWLAGSITALGIVPVPAVLGLLAEHALQAERLKWLQTSWKRWLFLVAAIVVLIALLVFVDRATRFPMPAILALIGLAVLVVAIVSGTLLDVAAVLLALALIGVAAPTAPSLQDPWPTAKHVIVAIGDSYLSGEGAAQFIDGTNDAGVDECRRARTAWPVLVARRAPFDGLVFLACSGAATYNLRTAQPGSLAPTPQAQYPRREGTQLESYLQHYQVLAPHPALVVVSIGGNDAGFSALGLMCLAPGNCGDPVPRALFRTGNLDRVANRLRQAYAEIRTTFPDSPVAVIPYPDPIDYANAPCAQAPLEDGDIAFIKAFMSRLDDRIQQVATEYGFVFAAPMRSALARQHLQLCDPANHGSAGINFVNASSVGGVSGNRFNPSTWKHGSLHPNEVGHAALARAFESWLVGLGKGDVTTGLGTLRPAVRTVPNPVGAPRAETYASGTNDDCASVDGPDACNQQATAWALGQVGKFLVIRAGWLVLLVVLLAWWAGIALVKRPARDS